ncbi:hypothetical protein FZI85_29920 [Mycobacterium sp. CBMA293]|uniref:hypothetical protein n=1 Tax=unclassified Mycolicibacterium TaxID=2636767 RepID=UPI0012DEA0BE|nr:MULTISPECIES: hypothetical protein [unclassified Mycolicibacterium]QGT51763.1 hypothetical protein pCBMA213_3_00021 [Mycolicibacterium sp.]MUL50056.1 hypothetical protein [Mycolicibacterium sp. CBMA 360]MUL62744.1 hypothetical protein [Mycolicibacterium sp. CBMA 335]MUL69612.1 hypothetical protein [Mycolicibacterium sp. CBMA 311]MUL97398.1 hypothetical protein [Mycolicibacterium sp. CBMA 230]
MTADLTNAATLLTALHEVLERDILDENHMSREPLMRYLNTQLTALYESGLVTPSQVAAHGTVDEMRRELIYSLYGADTALELALAGQF